MSQQAQQQQKRAEPSPARERPVYAVSPFTHGRAGEKARRYAQGDRVEATPAEFGELSTAGLVSYTRPVAEGQAPMPEGNPSVVKCRLLGNMKIDKERLSVGDVREFPVAEYKRLFLDGAVELVG